MQIDAGTKLIVIGESGTNNHVGHVAGVSYLVFLIKSFF